MKPHKREGKVGKVGEKKATRQLSLLSLQSASHKIINPLIIQVEES
jgi:hypothetical protein